MGCFGCYVSIIPFSVSLNLIFLSLHRCLCLELMDDLSIKKCVPCDLKDLRPMTKEVANGLLRQVAGWNLVNEGGVLKLNRSMKVKSFTKGLELFQLIAVLQKQKVTIQIFILL